MICFFFQADDGIRDRTVTGVQTCALPISRVRCQGVSPALRDLRHQRDSRAGTTGGGGINLLAPRAARRGTASPPEIGRASCRERGNTFGCVGRLRTNSPAVLCSVVPISSV